MQMREHLYRHATVLLAKVKKMLESGDLTVAQMSVGADILKDIAKLDKALSAACYYDSMSGASADKKY
jgi:hypothetical protein